MMIKTSRGKIEKVVKSDQVVSEINGIMEKEKTKLKPNACEEKVLEGSRNEQSGKNEK